MIKKIKAKVRIIKEKDIVKTEEKKSAKDKKLRVFKKTLEENPFLIP